MCGIKISEIKKSALKRMNECFPQVLMVMIIYLTAHLIFALGEFIFIQFCNMNKGVIFPEETSLVTITLITTVVRGFVEFMIIAPIGVGTAWWLSHCVRGENTNVGFVLICFSNAKIYFRSLVLRLVVGSIKAVMAIPLVLCAYIEYALIIGFGAESYRSGTYIALLVCCSLIFICMALIYLWVVMDFTLVNFVFTMNPDEKIVSIIRKSVVAMKFNRTKIIKLVCSFLGWIFAVFFVFPMFFAIPYAALSYAITVNGIIEKELRKNTDDMFNKKSIARK